MGRLLICCLALLLSVHAEYKSDGKCRALALEGGGSLGAYQVGALNALADLVLDDIAYNAVTGVSAGALNAFGMSLFPMGKELEMARFLNETWWGLSPDSIFTWSLVDLPYDLFYGKSLTSNEPLRALVTKLLAQQGGTLKRNITVGTTNFDTAHFTNFDESIGGTEMVEAVVCSSAIPAVFPFQNWQNETFVDGGVIHNLDVSSAIHRCQDAGYDDEDIIIDTIFLESAEIFELEVPKHLSAYDVYARVQAVKNYDGDMWYIKETMLAFPHVNYRYIIKPTMTMPGTPNMFDFEHDILIQDIADGYKDATDVINAYGTKGNAHEVIDEWKRTRDYRL